MPPKSNQTTLFEKFKSAILNNRIIAVLMVVGVCFTAFAAFTGSLMDFVARFKPKPEEWTRPLIRETYYTIEDDGISLLLQGHLDEALARRLGGKPIVIQNEVSEVLRDLQNRYARSRNLHDQYWMIDHGANPGDSGIENLSEKNWNENIPVIPSPDAHRLPTIVLEDARNSGFSVDLKDWGMRFIYDPNSDRIPDVISHARSGVIPPEITEFHRSLTVAELKPLLEANKSWKFYQHLVKDSTELCSFPTRIYFYGCGSDWNVEIRPPNIKLRVLVLENLTELPVTVSKMVFDQTVDQNWRTSLDGPIETVSKLPDLVLRDDERIIIPLFCYFEFSEEDRDGDGTDPIPEADLKRSELVEVLKATPSVKFVSLMSEESGEEVDGEEPAEPEDTGEGEEPVDDVDGEESAPKKLLELPGSDLAQAVENGAAPDSELPVFYFGPSYSPKSMLVDGRQTPVRPVSLGSISISQGSEAGSCPYAFLDFGDGKTPAPIGTVLTGRIGKENEGPYYRRLTKFPSSVLIRELEPETTFLKSIRIRIVHQDGSVTSFSPIGSSSLHASPEYTILDQGDSVAYSFESPPLINQTDRIELMVEGYYERRETTRNSGGAPGAP